MIAVAEKPKKIRLSDRTGQVLEDIKIETSYCVTGDERMANIRMSVARGLECTQPGPVTDEPIAIACFGPSLVPMIDELRQYDKIISMSGAHDVLLEHGIVPTWHIECDPRSHKAKFLKTPHNQTEYLISSCCHPEVFDAVLGFKTKIWHLFGNEIVEELPSIYPRKAWVLTGGTNVGLRALVLARFWGYRKLHVFGMDCSFESLTGKTHASFHPNSTKFRVKINVGDREFITSDVFIHYAQSFFDEVEKMPDTKVTLHGDGLLQAWAREKMKLPPKPHDPKLIGSLLAMSVKETISDEYLALTKQFHTERPDYGASGAKRVDTVSKLYATGQYATVLDYGCGKGLLGKTLTFPIWEYDPAIPGKDESPRPADLVICSDVLEHIEPDYLRVVLADLQRVTKKVLYAVVHTGPAVKSLPDGRNAHLIQENADWWKEKLSQVFEVASMNVVGNEVHTVCTPKKTSIPYMRSINSSLPAGDTITEVEHEGTKARFFTPNKSTQWRADTLFTKEPITIEWINSFQKDEVLWDIGANVGGYTVWAAKHRKVMVIAIEPEDKNFDLLTRNVALNECRAVAVCAAVSNEAKTSNLYLSGPAEAGSSCHTFGEALDPYLKPRLNLNTQPCTSTTIDALVEEQKVVVPNHIKIDVDGLEFKVIEGGLRTLMRPEVKSLLIEVNTNLEEHQAMIRKLQGLGWTYDVKQATAALRKDGPFKGCGEFLFTRAEEKVEVPVPSVYRPDMIDVKHHMLKQMMRADLRTKPYDHMFVENVFPPAYYAQMMENLPSSDLYKSLEEARGTMGYPDRFVCDLQVSSFWAALESMLRSGDLRQLLSLKFDVSAGRDECLLMKDKTGYKIGPHTDTPAKVLTALFYLPPDLALAPYGTAVYEPLEEGFTDTEGKHRPREEFKQVWSAPFVPNSVFIFARKDNSFHGVEGFDVPNRERNILLYDIRK